MGQTLTEKIIARAGGVSDVRPGQIVTVKVDLAMAHDFPARADGGLGSRNWA